MKDNAETNAGRKRKDVVLLADLAPRKDVKGGAGRLLFGERLAASEGADATDETRGA